MVLWRQELLKRIAPVLLLALDSLPPGQVGWDGSRRRDGSGIRLVGIRVLLSATFVGPGELGRALPFLDHPDVGPGGVLQTVGGGEAGDTCANDDHLDGFGFGHLVRLKSDLHWIDLPDVF